MKTARFEVLSPQEIERIHAASMEILSQVGIKVDYGKARELFVQAGAQVDEETQVVRIPERLVQWALQQAPSSFTLYGNDPDFQVKIGGDSVCFAGPGTPTHILDVETGERREVTLADLAPPPAASRTTWPTRTSPGRTSARCRQVVHACSLSTSAQRGSPDPRLILPATRIWQSAPSIG